MARCCWLGDVVAEDVIDLAELLTEQLAFQWARLTRPRLDGLTDQEYFGEPVQDCWTLRPISERKLGAAGDLVMDLGEVDDDRVAARPRSASHSWWAGAQPVWCPGS